MGIGQQLMQTWFRRVWSEEDPDAVDELFKGGEVRGLGLQTLLGPNEFKQFQSALCSLLSDITIQIDKSIENEEWVTVLCSVQAKAKQTDKQVKFTGTVWAKHKNGVLLEGYNHFDFMSLYGQLGLMPLNSFEQGLQGQKIIAE